MNKRFFQTLCWILALVLLVAGVSTMPAQAAPKTYFIKSTPEPKAIRVAIRENNPWGHPDPRGRIMYVKTYRFEDYLRNVLPNEWSPSWHANSLRSGAIAIKMFAWYHHLFPIKQSGFTFDVDNTVNFQTFLERTNQPETDAAITATSKLAYVMTDGRIFELNYRAGYQNSANAQYRNAQKMSQWGSQYWATRGYSPIQILQYYYEGHLLVTIPER